MPPVPIDANAFPKTIYGIHDLEGANFLAQNQSSSWLVHTVKLTTDAPTDYTPYVNQGLRVLVRLNNDYGSGGTIPKPSDYDTFAQQCADWVAASKGAQVWIIGNEMNHPSEYPSGLPITPQQYSSCFMKCRNAIHSKPGHANDQVVPGGVAPWNPDQGDWVLYFQTLYNLLNGNCDGICIHTYSHGNTPDTVTNENKMQAPYQNDHTDFRTYRDFMNVVPSGMRSLPVYITETQTIIQNGTLPSWTHQNTGWVQAAFSEINAWNQQANNQPIQALCLFRWKDDGTNHGWSVANYPEIQNDLQTAIGSNYKLVPPRAPQSDPGLRQAALQTARSVSWMPVNNTAALWRYAQAHGLQDQQTDELSFSYNGKNYIVQVFNKGICYCQVGDWTNVQVIPK